jgi:hypothetical protein
MPHFSRAVRVIGRRGSGILLPTNTTALSFTRNMSSDSSSPTKHLFAVYAPDCTDPGALDRRYSVREEHLKDIDRLHSSGIVSKCILLQYRPSDHNSIFFSRRIWGRPSGTGTHR